MNDDACKPPQRYVDLSVIPCNLGGRLHELQWSADEEAVVICARCFVTDPLIGTFESGYGSS